MAKFRQKEYIEKNVFDKAIERIEYLFNSFDNIVVNFSAGKDSTTVLNLVEIVAKKLDRKYNIHFYDEEAIHPPTVEYAYKVAELHKDKFKWYCLEFKHRNACSNSEPFWYCWDKEKEEKWVREKPNHSTVINNKDDFKKGMSFQEYSGLTTKQYKGRVAILTGVRTQESLRRLRAVSIKKNDNYIAMENGIAMCHPIYDWSSEDVWLAVHKFGWDYNKTYDIFNQTNLYQHFLQQRVCPPFGEEPLRGLWIYAECFPEMWHKMLNRVEGVATAWRYANTDLYGIKTKAKPTHLTYKEYLNILIDGYIGKDKQIVVNNINYLIKYHKKQTTQEIHDTDNHPLSGISYQFLCVIAIKGDFKGRTAPVAMSNASKIKKKLNITQAEAEKLYR